MAKYNLDEFTLMARTRLIFFTKKEAPKKKPLI
jgi:hypothetical protein